MDKDKRIETCLALYKQQMEHYHHTQQIEWRVTFAAWALLAAAIAISFQSPSDFRLPLWFAIVTPVPLIALVLAHIDWLQKIHASEHVDKDLWVGYRRMVHEFAGLPPPSHNFANPSEYTVEWIRLEAGTTFILAFVLWLRIVSLSPWSN